MKRWLPTIVITAALLTVGCDNRSPAGDAANVDAVGDSVVDTMAVDVAAETALPLDLFLLPDGACLRPDSGNAAPVEAAITSCAAISEGRGVCVLVSLDDVGVVSEVSAGMQNPPSADELTCIREALSGACLVQYLGQEPRESCAWGV